MLKLRRLPRPVARGAYVILSSARWRSVFVSVCLVALLHGAWALPVLIGTSFIAPAPSGVSGDPFYDIAKLGGIGNAQATLNTPGGGITFVPPGNYSTAGGYTVPRGMYLIGAGVNAVIFTHTGNNVCFLYDGQVAGPNYSDPDVRFVAADFTIYGNAGAAACGIELANSQSAWLERVIVGGRFGAGLGYLNGVALRLHNSVYWTENTVLNDFSSRYNATGIQLLRDGTGAQSFGYTKLMNYTCNLLAGQIGLDLGSSSVATCQAYNWVGMANFWMEGNGAIAINVPAVGKMESNCFVDFRGEATNAATGCLALKNRGIFRPTGLFAFDYGSPVATVDAAGAVDTRLNAYVLGSTIGVDLAVAPFVSAGTGNPNGALIAPVGSIYGRADGGQSTSIYVKTVGATNTGWTPSDLPAVQTPTEAVLVSGINSGIGRAVAVTLTAARVVGAPLNPFTGLRLSFTLIQGGAGTFAVTWNAVFKGVTGGTSGATGTRATFSFIYDGASWNLDGAQPTWV